MILLVVFAVLIPPLECGVSTANTLRTHLSDALKLRCDSLPYRTTYLGGRCYVAVNRLFPFSETAEQCDAVFPGFKVALDIPSEVFDRLKVEKTKFHTSSSSTGSKQFFCDYDSTYKCDANHEIIRGHCLVRADKRMNYADAEKHCARLGMELPSPSNDADNGVVAGKLTQDAAWVQNSYQASSSKYLWNKNDAKSYARYGACPSKDSTTSCNTPIASVIDKSGYWSNVEQKNVMDVVCKKNAENEFTGSAPPKPTLFPPPEEGCAPRHSWDGTTGQCEWTGPKDACAEIIDYWNNTWFITIPNYPSEVAQEECLKSTDNDLNEFVDRVVVRKGCMFTGYAHELGNKLQEVVLAADLTYGLHKIPSFFSKDTSDATGAWDSLTRAKCFCDRTEATLNGHVPAPPPDEECAMHHDYDETTKQCEWNLDKKYCGELWTADGRRKLIEIPNWPKNRRYDVDHYAQKYAEDFHWKVSKIIVRQHCFATLLCGPQLHEWRTLPTSGYGEHIVAGFYHNITRRNYEGTRRVICECIK